MFRDFYRLAPPCDTKNDALAHPSRHRGGTPAAESCSVPARARLLTLTSNFEMEMKDFISTRKISLSLGGGGGGGETGMFRRAASRRRSRRELLPDSSMLA